MSKSIGLDLSKFKHIASDEHSHTLKHYEGHELKIATKKLSKAHREALKAMADRAMAKAAEPNDKKAAKSTDNVVKREQQPPVMLNKGGDVPEYLRANPPENSEETKAAALSPLVVEDIKVDSTTPDIADSLPNLTKTGIANTLESVERGPADQLDRMAKLGYDDPYSQSVMRKDLIQQKEAQQAGALERKAEDQAATQATLKPLLQSAQEKQALNLPLSAEEQAAVGSQNVAAQTDINRQPASAAAPQEAVPQQQPAQDQLAAQQQSGLQQQLAGIEGESKAQQDLAKEQIELHKKQINDTNTAVAKYQEERGVLETERKALMQDIQEGHINPEKFWTGDPKTGEGGHSRMMAGIGMILAGFNPTNRPNAAIEYIQKQMDNNLLAQQKNLDSKNNLLALNLKQFGNLKDATEMTRIMQNDVFAHQLQIAAAKAQTPLAKAAALQASGKLMAENESKFQALSANRALTSLKNTAMNDPKSADAYFAGLDAVDPTGKRSAAARQLLIPGVGFANSKEDKEYLTQVQDRYLSIQANTNAAIEKIKKAGTYEALGPHNAELDRLAEDIATDKAKLLDPTSVARSDEVNRVKKTLVEAGLGNMNATAQKQLKSFAVDVENRRNRAFVTRGMRIDGNPMFASEQQQKTQKSEAALKWAQANPNNPKAADILKHLGQK